VSFFHRRREAEIELALSEILREEFPRLPLAIGKIILSRDSSTARILLDLESLSAAQQERFLARAEKATGRLRSLLAVRCSGRKAVPQLILEKDRGAEAAARVDALLKGLSKKEGC